MTSYRQLQSDDASDTFDLDSQPDNFQPREETEVQIEPTRSRTKSKVRLPNTTCTKNKVIAVLIVMLSVLLLIATLTIYELHKHGVKCHHEDLQRTPIPTTVVYTTPVATTAPVTVATTSATATNGDLFPWNDIRLPQSVKPFLYEISLHPNLITFEVNGEVVLHFNTTEEVNFIVMHAKDMNITQPEHLELVDAQPASVEIEKLLFYPQNEQISVNFAQPVPSGAHCILTLQFNYTLKDGLEGFYRSSYKKEGITRHIATTQFEATYARKAFPCFDEPAMKASFSMKLARSRDYMTLFNMPATMRGAPYGTDDDVVQDIYPITVPMSTYLVAFVVCDFLNISSTSANTKVAVYASEDKLDQAELALDVVSRTIDFYESLFDIDYPLPKQDMIAIPDFSAGAMENWGLITYRESSILYQENVTSVDQESWIVTTITHELAHQWFGNLVTMQWWSDLWLNEGFASFIQFIGADHFEPDWKMMDKFILETTQVAMHEDQVANSHPITVEVNNPDEISEIFDQISYGKGATILKMLQSFLMKGNQDVMMKGIQVYLKKFKYSNAQTSDLWAIISKEASKASSGNGVDVSAMMDTWTLQMGFPMINMTLQGSKVTASQQRFLLYPQGDPSPEFNSTYGYKWTVPLTYFTQSDPKNIRTEVLKSEEDQIVFNIQNAKWFKANIEQSGMYRVNYDKATWQALVKQLLTDHNIFSRPADRASLIDDAFHLAWAGYIDYSIPLNMSLYLMNEMEYVPIETALHGLGTIGAVLYGREGFTYYKDYILQLFKGLSKKLGLEDTGSHLEKLLRVSILTAFRRVGHTDTLKWASDKYKEWMKNNRTDVGANLRGLVLCGGLQYGHQDEWDFAWNQYQKTSSPTEKASILYHLACTQDPAILHRYLYMSLDGEKIRQQDSERVIISIAQNHVGAYMAFSFLIENWDLIKDRIGSQPFVMTSLITGTTGWISTEFEYQIAKQFFEQHQDDTGQGTRSSRQSLEDMKMRIDWLKNHEQTVTAWLKKVTTQASAASS